MTDRRCFLSHFVLCLAIAGGGFFAYMKGVPQAIYAADESMVTSLIFAAFLGSAAWLGVSSWRMDSRGVHFGHLATEISVMLGLLGTTIGLSLQAKALIGGSAAFGPLATSLFATMSGIAAALALRVMTFNLELGLRK